MLQSSWDSGARESRDELFVDELLSCLRWRYPSHVRYM